jgi:hypothetical protein
MQCVEPDPWDRPTSMTQVYERLELAITQMLQEAKQKPIGNRADDSRLDDSGSSIFEVSKAAGEGGSDSATDSSGIIVADLLSADTGSFDPSQFLDSPDKDEDDEDDDAAKRKKS